MPFELRGRLRTPPAYHVTFNQSDPLHPAYTLEQLRSGAARADSSFKTSFRGRDAAVSVWKTPKRTRTYPYSRMYYTLNRSSCCPITVIPVVKDEGKGHDRDYIQWDSLSLTSYVGIYAILAYYIAARKESEDRVTDFLLDWEFVSDKILQILESNITPREWNDKERLDVSNVTRQVLQGQDDINRITGVPLNDRESLIRHLGKLENPISFMASSRKLSAAAQKREAAMQQPKELTEKVLKATITLQDSYEGIYNWTIDELRIVRNKALLIDKKHGRSVPHYDDLSDSFFKMIFFTNITELIGPNEMKLQPVPVVTMTSEVGEGACFNTCPIFETCDLIHCTYPPIIRYNDVPRPVQSEGETRAAFIEGRQNNFLVFVMGSQNALTAETSIFAEYLAG